MARHAHDFFFPVLGCAVFLFFHLFDMFCFLGTSLVLEFFFLVIAQPLPPQCGHQNSHRLVHVCETPADFDS